MQQLPLPLRWRPDQSLSDFVFVEAAAEALLRKALAAPAQPLLLRGASGSGKSTLLAAAHRESGLPWVDLKHLSDCGTDLQRIVQAQLIDHLELASAAQQTALFQSYNRAHDQGLSWIACLQGASEDYPGLADLRSRLQQCVQLVLPRLHDETQRRHVLRTQAEGLGFALDDKVMDYLDIHVSRDLAQLSQVLNLLNAWSLSQKKKPSLAQVRSLLRQPDIG